MYFVFCRLYHSSPCHHGSVWLLPVISLLFNLLCSRQKLTCVKSGQILHIASNYGVCNAIAKFLVPDWDDIVNSGIGLSYLPAGLHRLAGRYYSPMPQSIISPSQGLKIILSSDLQFKREGFTSLINTS